jgi:hypothetical protein
MKIIIYITGLCIAGEICLPIKKQTGKKDRINNTPYPNRGEGKEKNQPNAIRNKSKNSNLSFLIFTVNLGLRIKSNSELNVPRIIILC